MMKIIFDSDHDMYTNLGILNLKNSNLEVIYNIPNNKDLDDEDFIDDNDRLKEINKIIRVHNMDKIHGCFPIIGLSIQESGVYVLIDNFSGDCDSLGYILYLQRLLPDKYDWSKLIFHHKKLINLIGGYKNEKG